MVSTASGFNHNPQQIYYNKYGGVSKKISGGQGIAHSAYANNTVYGGFG